MRHGGDAWQPGGLQVIKATFRETLNLIKEWFVLFSCVCDDGWTGRFCEHAKERECEDDIDNDGSEWRNVFRKVKPCSTSLSKYSMF